MVKPLVVSALTLTVGACASLAELRSLVQPPRFTDAQDRSAEIRLLGPGVNRRRSIRLSESGLVS